MIRLNLAHRRVSRLVDAHVDGELLSAARARVTDHAVHCADCRHGIALTKQVKASLRRAAAQRPPKLATRRLRRLVEEVAGG